MNRITECVLFVVWLFALSITVLRLSHVVACIIVLFVAEEYSIAWRNHSLCIHSPAVAITNNAVMNICIHLCTDICFRFSWINPRGGMAAFYGRCMFNSQKRLPVCFSKGLFYIPTSSVLELYPSTSSLACFNLIGDQRYYNAALIYICLMHFFTCLFTVCASSLVQPLFTSFPNFSWVVCFLIAEFGEYFIYSGHESFISYDLKLLFPSLWLVFLLSF